MMPEAQIEELPIYNADELEIQVREALENQTLSDLRELVNNQYTQDIADVIERLRDGDADYAVFDLLAPDVAAEVLDELGRYATSVILQRMPAERVASLLNRMPLDDLVEILSEDIPERSDEVLEKMLPQTAQEIRELLSYPEDSAGRLMTRKYVRVNQDMTASEVLEHIRRVDSRVETVTNAYVLDPMNRLVGVISLRETLTQPPKRQVKDYMETQIISIEPTEDQEVAARTIARYDFLALPVVTPDQRMLGIITVDDAIDVLAEENTEDIMRFGGVSGDANDEPYFTVPILRVVRSRLMWLVLLFLADFITNNVLRGFEGELDSLVLLSFYIPLLIGTGGNTGSQTVSMIIRGMAVNDIRPGDIFRVVRREMFSGVILGALLGAIGLARAYFIDGSWDFAVVIGVSMLAVCAWANVIGSIIPMAAKRAGIDPAVVSAPMISTLVDATGLFIYLSIATAILGL